MNNRDKETSVPSLPGRNKTDIPHWENAWSRPPRMRLPSSLNVATRNLQRILKVHVKPGMKFLEIGCAPGKILVWVAKSLRADVSGLDYSERGLGHARRLFQALNVEGDLRCEDLFETTFAPEYFDMVFSAGVIEHFEDPREIIRRHVLLLKRGGTALITVPNFGGVYGKLQNRWDPERLSTHNTSIMFPPALEKLAPSDLVTGVHAYYAGRLSPWLVSFHRLRPSQLAKACAYILNAVGVLQPVDIIPVCPMLVLELHR